MAEEKQQQSPVFIALRQYQKKDRLNDTAKKPAGKVKSNIFLDIPIDSSKIFIGTEDFKSK